MKKIKKMRLLVCVLLVSMMVCVPYLIYNIGFSRGVSSFKGGAATYIQTENEVSPSLAAKVLGNGLHFKQETLSFLEFYDRGFAAGNNSEAQKILNKNTNP
jgi:hypothetical protein